MRQKPNTDDKCRLVTQTEVLRALEFRGKVYEVAR